MRHLWTVTETGPVPCRQKLSLPVRETGPASFDRSRRDRKCWPEPSLHCHCDNNKEHHITPAPVCANMIQILVHTYRGLGCSIFVEMNAKRQSNPSPLIVFNILHCSAHIQPNTISSKYHFKKCVPFRWHNTALGQWTHGIMMQHKCCRNYLQLNPNPVQ